VAVLFALVRRHRCAVGAVVRRVVDDEVPGAVEEEAGQAAMRLVPPGLMDALPVHALGALGIVVGVQDVLIFTSHHPPRTRKRTPASAPWNAGQHQEGRRALCSAPSHHFATGRFPPPRGRPHIGRVAAAGCVDALTDAGKDAGLIGKAGKTNGAGEMGTNALPAAIVI